MSSINLIFSKVQMVRSVTLCLTCWVSKSQWLPLDGPCLKTSSGHNWFWTSDLMFSKLTDNALNYQYEPFFIYNIHDLTNQQNLISIKVRNRTTNCLGEPLLMNMMNTSILEMWISQNLWKLMSTSKWNKIQDTITTLT